MTPRGLASALPAMALKRAPAAPRGLPVPAAAGAVARSRGGWAPTVVDLTFAIWGLAIPLAMAHRLVNGDGDLFWHLRFGQEMLRTRAMVHTDILSFTNVTHPMVIYEWGSEVLFAVAYGIGGFPGVALLVALVIASSLALVTRFLLRRGVDPLLAFLAVTAGAILSSVHWVARPHVFTLLCIALLLHVLEPGGRRRLWPAVLLFLVWANLHPGFAFGLALVAAYIAGDALELATGGGRAEWTSRLRYHAGVLGVALCASLLNPNGLGLIEHVFWMTAGNGGYIRDHTNEFRSPDFHLLAGKMFLLGLLASIAILATARRRPLYPRLVAMLGVIALALTGGRYIAMFGLVTPPLLALCVDPDWRRLRAGGLRRARLAFLGPHRGGTGGRWACALGAALLVLLVVPGTWSRGWVRAQVDPQVFPVAAVQHARTANLQGRMIGDFAWSGYMDLAWPEQRVFIDGHTDFYGPELMREYVDATGLQPGWRDTLRKWDISLALFPPTSKFLTELAREPGWTTWYADSTAVLLRRTGAPDSR